MNFKGVEYEGVLAPSGYWIVIREDIPPPGWVVWVYDFANWKHRARQFATEQEAREYFWQWTI